MTDQFPIRGIIPPLATPLTQDARLTPLPCTACSTM